MEKKAWNSDCTESFRSVTTRYGTVPYALRTLTVAVTGNGALQELLSNTSSKTTDGVLHFRYSDENLLLLLPLHPYDLINLNYGADRPSNRPTCPTMCPVPSLFLSPFVK